VRNALFSVAAAVAAVIMIAAVGGGNQGRTAQAKVSIKVIQMFRSVTVSPSAVACGHYTGGSDGNVSTATALGFPGQCTVGDLSSSANLPLTVTYNGPPGVVRVKASDAVPDGSGPSWQLCGPGTSPGCKGVNGAPGTDQFGLETFSRINSTPTRLTGQWQCDTQFNPNGNCAATRGMFQHEGALIMGPATTETQSITYTVTITWMACPVTDCVP
jgi:hypothetical protein